MFTSLDNQGLVKIQNSRTPPLPLPLPLTPPLISSSLIQSTLIKSSLIRSNTTESIPVSPSTPSTPLTPLTPLTPSTPLSPHQIQTRSPRQFQIRSPNLNTDRRILEKNTATNIKFLENLIVEIKDSQSMLIANMSLNKSKISLKKKEDIKSFVDESEVHINAMLKLKDFLLREPTTKPKFDHTKSVNDDDLI